MPHSNLEYIIAIVITVSLVGVGTLLFLNNQPENSIEGQVSNEVLLIRAQEFVSHRQLLSQSQIDTDFFNSSEFRLVQTINNPISSQPVESGA